MTCRKTLLLTEPCSDRDRLIRLKGQRVQGSSEWIRSNELYSNWLGLDSGNQILAITGGPGKGKTMLSLSVTEELQNLQWQTPRMDVIYFFCDSQDERRNTAVAVLRGLICQIIDSRPNVANRIWPHLDTPEKAWFKVTSLQALWTIFTNILEDPDVGTIFCVLDGLDECDNYSLSVLAPKLQDLFSPCIEGPVPNNFRLLISAREIPWLSNTLTICLNSDAKQIMQRDMRNFIFSEVKEMSRARKTNHFVRDRIRCNVERLADGCFLSASLILNDLSRLPTSAEIVEALEHFSEGLDAIYSQILLRIKAEDQHACSMVLKWVTMARRALTVEELAAAIQPQITLKNNQDIIKYVTLCGPLLNLCDGEVILVHTSLLGIILLGHRMIII